MTGEVTLTGRVLAIGGVREKAIAARRSGVTTMIFPRANAAGTLCGDYVFFFTFLRYLCLDTDVEELPDHICKDITVCFVEHYSDVFEIAFGETYNHNDVE